MVKFAIALVAGMWLALVASSWAEAATDEYNFNWLDTDKKIYVLQNRKFTKAGRALVSGMAGIGLSSAYRDSYQAQGRMAFYFSEMFGVEAFYAYQANTENNTFEALKASAPNTLPYVREVRGQFGGLLHYVPWYAKINVFNWIMYFDWYFSAGAGQVQCKLDKRRNSASAASLHDQNFFGMYAGTGHQYHLTRSLTVRFDFTGVFYRAPLLGDSGTNTWFSNYMISLGAGLRI